MVEYKPCQIVWLDEHPYTPEEAAIEIEEDRLEAEEDEEWFRNHPEITPRKLDFIVEVYYTSRGCVQIFYGMSVKQPYTLEEVEKLLEEQEKEEEKKRRIRENSYREMTDSERRQLRGLQINATTRSASYNLARNSNVCN